MTNIGVLSPNKQKLLETGGYLLAVGGPGSGKTTVALLKADRDIRDGILKPGQKIIFLSFARATVSRVAEQATNLLHRDIANHLEINTYHGFIWKLIRSHGYLLYGGGRIKLLGPPQAAARLAHFKTSESKRTEKRRLFEDEGLLDFDLFASLAADLLTRSKALRRIICDAYPLIILDEFQDTNADEWAFIKAIGQQSTLIALADAEQRIYEFRGADPRRIAEYQAEFKPATFDFSDENHRSNGKDIAAFGNDLLIGANKGKAYNDVTVEPYGFRQNRSDLFPVKLSLIKRIQALKKSHGNEWSLAILVPSKNLMLRVSEYLDVRGDQLPAIRHDVMLDTEGPALAAAVISTLLEGGQPDELAPRVIGELCQHISGRRGSKAPPQGDLLLVDALGTYLNSGKIRGAKRQRVVDGALAVATARQNLELTGDPEEDWLATRRLMVGTELPELIQVAEDARYLRLLHKGALLRGRLNEIWRAHGSYRGAPQAVSDALMQEHFLASTRAWRGVHVMTLHKAKGKEFTEVIIFESRYLRLLREGSSENEVAQALRALRVGVTRAMQRATILTPDNDPCQFLC